MFAGRQNLQLSQRGLTVAVDTFTWCTQVQGNGGAMSVTNNVRMVSMGNGYRQVASSGRNTNRREFSVVYGGRDYLDVMNFIMSHTYKPFIWTPPDGRIGLFTVKPDSIGSGVKFRGMQEINCTFTEEFTSAR